MDRFTPREILSAVHVAAPSENAIFLFWVTYGLRRLLLDPEPIIDCFGNIEDVFRRVLQKIEVRQ